ncbi:MAG TPA: ATP-binding protein [Sphingobacteriaceae bacterium]
METIKILLVDDDEDDFILTRDLLSRIPQSGDYQLDWCSNYEGGINAMLKGMYDVYLVDYRLGKQTGIDLLREAIKSNVSEPVIILTGKGDSHVDEEALRNGAADYLIKDRIDPMTLERSIRYSRMHARTLGELRESENKFRIMFERSLDPMVISDYSGRIYDINKAGTDFFGLSYTELLKRNARDFYRNGSDRVAFIQEIEEKGVVNDLEVELINGEGASRYCSLSAFLQISQHGNIELYHILIHDITFRKQLEQQSMSTEKLAVYERIAKSLATEIRNPLSNVNLAVDELTLELSGQEQPGEYLKIIRDNCERIHQLTNEFISCTQPGSLYWDLFNPGEVVTGLVEQIEEVTELNNIRCILEIDPEPVLLKGDEEKLKQALQHLINNAIESMAGYAKTLHVITGQTPHSYHIQIRDTGCGISPENSARVFEPFFSTKKKGSGLGLTNAQNVIAAHGGKITFDSKPGLGTTFHVFLPLNL